ncbi:hypothetical protein RYX36_006677, partial [Vicia faba]
SPNPWNGSSGSDRNTYELETKPKPKPILPCKDLPLKLRPSPLIPLSLLKIDIENKERTILMLRGLRLRENGFKRTIKKLKMLKGKELSK